MDVWGYVRMALDWRAASTAERSLWRILRNLDTYGYGFRRQANYKSYVLDFVEHSSRLVIDLDGSGAAMANGSGASRNDELRDDGYRVLQISSADLENNPEEVTERILALLLVPPPRRRPKPETLSA